MSEEATKVLGTTRRFIRNTIVIVIAGILLLAAVLGVIEYRHYWHVSNVRLVLKHGNGCTSPEFPLLVGIFNDLSRDCE